jgi:hypothetical protein
VTSDDNEQFSQVPPVEVELVNELNRTWAKPGAGTFANNSSKRFAKMGQVSIPEKTYPGVRRTDNFLGFPGPESRNFSKYSVRNESRTQAHHPLRS